MAVILLGSVAWTACSADAAEGVGSSDAEQRIKPVDHDGWAYVSVRLPDGTCQLGGACKRPLGESATVTIDALPAELGVQQRVRPGNHDIVTNGAKYTVSLAAGQKRVVVLAVARAASVDVPSTDFGSWLGADAAFPTPTIKAGPSSTLGIALLGMGACGGSTLFQAPSVAAPTRASCAALNVFGRVSAARAVGSNQCSGFAELDPRVACERAFDGEYGGYPVPRISTTDFAFAPGEYEATTYGQDDEAAAALSLGEGDVTELAGPRVPDVFTTTISFSDARELPTAVSPWIETSCKGDRGYAVPATGTDTLKLTAFKRPQCEYTLRAGGRSVTLDQNGKNEISLRRVDVDPVDVWGQGQAAYNAQGTYALYFGGNAVVWKVPTGQGVDVLPGDYELVVTYWTYEGYKEQRTQLHL
jgi:hypothetical protein